MSKKTVIETMMLISAISGETYNIDDIVNAIMNPKMKTYSDSIFTEIIQLLNEGHTEEEITKIINDCGFTEANDLNDEEKENLRQNAHKTLKRIINIRKREDDIYE